MFEVIPAIDLQAGRCVRLVQGDFQRSTVFGDDPVGMAQGWESAGATRIHLVDLDGARQGHPTQLQVVGAIARAVGVPIQLGGGLRTLADVERAFEAGVDRAIVGTAALEDRVQLEACLARYAGRIAVGIDAREDRVAVRGWLDVSSTDALAFASSLAALGVRTIVFTDIGRDGMLGAPNLAAVRGMVEAVPEVDVIASGGVGGLNDLIELSQIGARGAIVGRALYTGAVDLGTAITALREREPTGSQARC